MDKYEFNIKVEQIKKMVNKEDFATAMKIADTIDWRRVRNANLLSTISQVYEKNEEYQEAKEVLLLAFERAPIGKRILYKLTELALKEGSVREAEDYYQEFCELAPEDTRQYILHYLILKEKNASLDQLIQALERYINTELDEKWMYELAELYARAGRGNDCVQLCDKMILMFGIGTYVEKAAELKKRYAPPNSQQRKPVQFQNRSGKNGTAIQIPGTSGYNGNWQDPGENYGGGTKGYGTDNNYGTGYGPENGYGAGAGYGSGGDYGAESGYGPVDGYGAGAGYDSGNSYETGTGYGTGAGYGSGNGYEANEGYDVGNGYGAGPDYNAGNGYGTESGHNAGNSYRTEPVYSAGNGYGTEPGYSAGNGYETEPGYNAGNGYGTEPGYNAGNGYGTEPDYNAGNGYGTEPGYNAGRGYDTEPDYDAGNGYGAETVYGAGNGYGAGTGYGNGNSYGTGANYGSGNSYEVPAATDNGYGVNTAYNMDNQSPPVYNSMNNYRDTGNYGLQEPYEDNPAYHTGNVYTTHDNYNTGDGYKSNHVYGAAPDYGSDAGNGIPDNYTGNAYVPQERYGNSRGNYHADMVYGNDMAYDSGAGYSPESGYGTGAGYSAGRDYRENTVYETDNGYGRDETYGTDPSYDSGAWSGAEEEVPPQRPVGYGAREYSYTHPHGGYPPAGPYVVDEELMANLHQAAAEKELAAEMSRISTEEYAEPEPMSNQTRVFRGKNNIRVLRPRMEEEEKPFYHRSYTPHHMIIEAKTAQEGIKTAVEELKKVHQETGVNNSVIKITGSKLSKRGVINVSDKLAGKDLIVEEAGDLTQRDLEELQMLLERDETGMIVVLIDNPHQIKELHRQNPGFINLFKCIGHENDAKEPVQAAGQDDGRKQEEPYCQEGPEFSGQQPEVEPVLESEQESQPEQIPEPASEAEPEEDSEPEPKLNTEPEPEEDFEKEPEPEPQQGQEEPQEPADMEDPEQVPDSFVEEIDSEDENPEEPVEPDNESYDSGEYEERGYPEKEYPEREYPEEEYPEEEYLKEGYQDGEPDEERYNEAYDEVYDDEGEYNDEEYEDPEPVDEDEELGIDAFTDYAVQYASEIDCSITGKSLLALCQHVETMEENGIPLTRANAEDMIEEAADKAEKPSIGGLIKGVFSSKYDKDGLLILKEEHFL